VIYWSGDPQQIGPRPDARPIRAYLPSSAHLREDLHARHRSNNDAEKIAARRRQLGLKVRRMAGRRARRCPAELQAAFDKADAELSSTSATSSAAS
jgi:hypothetical protein